MFKPIEKTYDALVTRPLVKFSGDAYTGGNLTLLGIGGMGSAWNEMVGAATFLVMGLMLSQRGDREGWFASACALGIPGTVITNIHGLEAGTTATIIGVGVCAAGATLGITSKYLTQKFQESGNALVRYTPLGAPREWMGGLFLSSKPFLLYDAIAQEKWGYTGVLLLWAAGDVCMGLSSAKTTCVQPQKETKRAQPHKATRYTQRHTTQKSPTKPLVPYKYRKASPKA